MWDDVVIERNLTSQDIKSILKKELPRINNFPCAQKRVKKRLVDDKAKSRVFTEMCSIF